MVSGETISIKRYQRDGEQLLAACDEELLDRTLREGELSLTIYRSFYHAESCDGPTLCRYLEMASIANLVGERTVAVAVKMGLVERSCVMMIDGVPHAQMVRL